MAMPLFTVSSGSIPAGNYTGTFLGVVDQPANKERDYPPGLRWQFQIDAGDFKGKTASRITGPTPSPTNSCGTLLSGLIGRPLQEKEQINPDDFLGKRYVIRIAATQKGATRVESVVPMPADNVVPGSPAGALRYVGFGSRTQAQPAADGQGGATGVDGVTPKVDV
jgi:hypothetical protein